MMTSLANRGLAILTTERVLASGKAIAVAMVMLTEARGQDLSPENQKKSPPSSYHVRVPSHSTEAGAPLARSLHDGAAVVANFCARDDTAAWVH